MYGTNMALKFLTFVEVKIQFIHLISNPRKFLSREENAKPFCEIEFKVSSLA